MDALVPKWPTLTATWANSSSSQTILGETGTTDSHVRTLNFVSTYQLDGFSLFGTYNHQNFDVTFPAFLAGSNMQSESVNNNLSFAASHPLPWNGSFSAAYYRSNYDSSTNTVLNNGTSNTLVGSFGFAPSQKFTFGGDVRHYDNLVGALQNVIPGGGVPLVPFNVTGDGLSLSVYGTYNIGHGFGLLGYANHSANNFDGVEYTSTQGGGTLTYNYAQPILGFMYFSAGVVSTGNNNNNGNMAGVGSIALKKILKGWDLNADASYSQNVQNSIAWFTTSNYNYGGSVRRRFGQFTYWTTSARDTRTGMTQIAGYNTHTETYMTMISRKGVAVSGSYSQNDGASILTSSGVLVSTPLAPVLTPGELIFNGTVYGGTVSVSPLRRMAITGSWFRTNSNTYSNVTDSGAIYSNNSSNRIYAVMTYKFRKLDFLATYWKTNQEISSSGLPRAIQNNYSFTISRWFNVF